MRKYSSKNIKAAINIYIYIAICIGGILVVQCDSTVWIYTRLAISLWYIHIVNKILPVPEIQKMGTNVTDAHV